MSDVSALFITEYMTDVKIAYQQMASKLRKAVYLKTGVKASEARFQKAGKGVARQKQGTVKCRPWASPTVRSKPRWSLVCR